ncbi:unnamed protein product [Amoebophrya sp. A120]|nr:unnamed protein product [Amoebophrya sp. A120]|eukprot:GSA120T00020819001.1
MIRSKEVGISRNMSPRRISSCRGVRNKFAAPAQSILVLATTSTAALLVWLPVAHGFRPVLGAYGGSFWGAAATSRSGVPNAAFLRTEGDSTISRDQQGLIISGTSGKASAPRSPGSVEPPSDDGAPNGAGPSSSLVRAAPPTTPCVMTADPQSPNSLRTPLAAQSYSPNAATAEAVPWGRFTMAVDMSRGGMLCLPVEVVDGRGGRSATTSTSDEDPTDTNPPAPDHAASFSTRATTVDGAAGSFGAAQEQRATSFDSGDSFETCGSASSTGRSCSCCACCPRSCRLNLFGNGGGRRTFAGREGQLHQVGFLDCESPPRRPGERGSPGSRACSTASFGRPPPQGATSSPHAGNTLSPATAKHQARPPRRSGSGSGISLQRTNTGTTLESVAEGGSSEDGSGPGESRSPQRQRSAEEDHEDPPRSLEDRFHLGVETITDNDTAVRLKNAKERLRSSSDHLRSILD